MKLLNTTRDTLSTTTDGLLREVIRLTKDSRNPELLACVRSSCGVLAEAYTEELQNLSSIIVRLDAIRKQMGLLYDELDTLEEMHGILGIPLTIQIKNLRLEVKQIAKEVL